MLMTIALVARREFFIRQRGQEQYSSIDFHAAVEIGIVGASFLVILLSPYLLSMVSRIRLTSLVPLALFFVFSIVAIPLSENPFYSAFFAAEYLSQLVVIFCIVASANSREEAVQKLLIITIAATVLTSGLMITRNGFTGGLFDYKSNSGGACGAILGIFCFVYFVGESYTRRTRQLLIAGVIIGVGSVALTTSAASIISLAFGICFASLIAGKGKLPLILLVAILGGLGFVFPDYAFNVLFPGKDIVHVQNMHGRTLFWDDAFAIYLERPFFGYGYAMAAKTSNLQGTNLHNSFLSLLVGNGLIGALFFAVAIARTSWCSVNIIRKKVPGAIPAFAAFATGLLNANTISFFGEDWRGASLVFLSFWVFLSFSILVEQTNTSRSPTEGSSFFVPSSPK